MPCSATTLPIAICLAAGLPIVATTHAMLPHQPVTNAVLPAETPEHFAQSVITAYDNLGEWTTRSAAATQQCRSTFMSGAAAALYRDLHRQETDSAPITPPA